MLVEESKEIKPSLIAQSGVAPSSVTTPNQVPVAVAVQSRAPGSASSRFVEEQRDEPAGDLR